MKNLNKIAEHDAFNWARAEMFFGKGAGTQRKLVWAEIHEKMIRIPGYEEAFQKAYSQQDMAQHAVKAAKMRKNIDRAALVNRNTKALIRGDRRNLSPILAVAIAGGFLLHETGYDKVALEKAKVYKAKAKRYLKDLNERYAR